MVGIAGLLVGGAPGVRGLPGAGAGAGVPGGTRVGTL